MTTILDLDAIKSTIPKLNLVQLMEEGFRQYDKGTVLVPPVGELLFEDPPGEAHIKYGYIKGQDHYVIKIASGFYNNPQLGLSSSQGVMLVFSQKTGQLDAVLLDEGHLTNIRTAAAGALAAKYFSPKKVHAIGVVGTGIQGRLQLQFLKDIVGCRNVVVWDINHDNALAYEQMHKDDYKVTVVKSPSELVKRCNLIITTTPSTSPLVSASDLKPGTHITAVGSDTPEKQELDSHILARADLVITDSKSQCQSRGEIFRALQSGIVPKAQISSLGSAIQEEKLRRTNDDQISVVDLTGVAVQDIQIATAVYQGFIQSQNEVKS